MVIIKRFAYILLMVTLGTMTLLSCRNKTESSKKVEVNKPKQLQTNKSDSSNNLSNDSSVQALSDKENQELTDNSKVQEMINPVIAGFIEGFYNCTPSTVDQVFDKLSTYSGFDNGAAFGDRTDNFKNSMKNYNEKLINYHISKSDIGIFVTSKDGSKTYYGSNQTIIVNYTENGVNKIDKVKLTLAHNVKGDKTFKITDIDIQEQQNIK
ncbi:hypothetical protein [Clostridium fungisolvens]|uniref:Lipoprotein n=1 Tax=Clostridium fungisolvens TaxID=1604897 RepID=A0A6V8SGN3_9CLOT|nr:hypothetical protein [Clostridium fungisolvens]GFP75625.1 hypothetical protein bsdtw1_01712 [Clostridium fungisolvens]